ncbi:MAG: hypothetical protein ABW156_00940 [Jiangellaceae bacterium]
MASAANAGRRSGSVSWKNCRVTLEPTVVTNSIQVAEVLYGGTADQTVVLTGGVRTASDALVGPVAVNALLGISTIAALEDADLLVTDEGMPKDIVRLLADRVNNLVIASVDESRS